MKTLLITLFFSCIFNNPIFHGGHKITIGQVEEIMGENCTLNEENSTNNENGHRYTCTYEALNNSLEINRLLFIFESFKDNYQAIKKFEVYSNGNSENQYFEKIKSEGDQAFYLTDMKNYALLIIRKNNELIRIKVNKISPKTSKANMLKVGNNIIARI